MAERKMTEEESLALIQSMIQAARNEHNENGLGWRIWGWVLFVASFGTYLAMEFQWKGSFWLWNLALPVGVVLMIVNALQKRTHKKNLTYAQDLLDRIGVGFFASLLSMIAGINIYFAYSAKPADTDFWGFFYILYAFWMYIHGSALKFRPLILGAILNWLAGILMFYIADLKYEMLAGSVAILLGYLVPGYLLFLESKRRKS